MDVANLNSPGQIVISGESSKVALAVSLAKEHGIRLAKTLNVAGAYHSRLMNSAFLKLGEELQKTPLADPALPGHLQCRCHARCASAEEIRSSLQDQVTGTVRWTETIEYLVDEEKCDLFLELGPGGVLAGLLNRTRKGTPCLSITDATSLEAALAILRG